MNLLFFDTETTGKGDFKLSETHKSQPHIIQLGAILTNDIGEEKAKVSTLVKLLPGYEIEKQATGVHGITNEDAERFGIPPLVALSLFNNLVLNCDRIVCHNTQFDILVMRVLAHRLNQPDTTIEKDIFCTMKSYASICKLPGKYGYKWPKLQEAYRHVFGCDFEGAHDALCDVIPTKELYFKLAPDPPASTLDETAILQQNEIIEDSGVKS